MDKIRGEIGVFTDAIKDEMESMLINQVWDLMDLLVGHKAIENKWVLKIKRKADGEV